MLRCSDGVVLHLVSCQGSPETKVEEIGPAEAKRRLAAGEPQAGLHASSADVRACFAGRALARSRATKKLRPVDREAIFGRASDAGRDVFSRYQTGRVYSNIGRAITDRCAAHPEQPLPETCAKCAAHQRVCVELADAPLEILRAAAKKSDPDEQILAALWAKTSKVRVRRARQTTP